MVIPPEIEKSLLISYEMGFLSKDIILSAMPPRLHLPPELVREGSLYLAVAAYPSLSRNEKR